MDNFIISKIINFPSHNPKIQNIQLSHYEGDIEDVVENLVSDISSIILEEIELNPETDEGDFYLEDVHRKAYKIGKKLIIKYLDEIC